MAATAPYARVVLLTFGPVPSSCALAWINYGREVLALVSADPRSIPASIISQFSHYLDEWTEAAHADDTFRWEMETTTESVEYLVTWLYRLGDRIEDDAEEGIARLRPPEADRFHQHVVNACLGTLEREGPAEAHFVEEMRATWSIARRP